MPVRSVASASIVASDSPQQIRAQGEDHILHGSESWSRLGHLGDINIDSGAGGQSIYLSAGAPPPEQGYHRVQQVLAIDEAIRTRASKAASIPPILCGDLNAEPGSDEVRFLSGLATIDGRSTYFQDAWIASGHTEPGCTWDGRQNELAASMMLPPKRIDYVFVGDPYEREDGAGLVISCDLAFHRPLTGLHASDHFGLVAEVRSPGPRPSPVVSGGADRAEGCSSGNITLEQASRAVRADRDAR